MRERLYSLEIRGREKRWSLDLYARPEHVRDWVADGLDVREVLNTVPDWLPWWLVKAWCFAQDVLNFKNPWGPG